MQTTVDTHNFPALCCIYLCFLCPQFPGLFKVHSEPAGKSPKLTPFNKLLILDASGLGALFNNK